MVEVRRIIAGEGQRLRAIRLRALADSPQAFGTTLAEAERVPEEVWSGRAERGAASDTAIYVVACEGEEWCGLAGGYLEPETAGLVELVSL